MLAISGANEDCDGGRGASAGQRDAEAAQVLGGVMAAEIFRRRMEVRRGRKHPQAKQHRQQDGEASLQAMRRQ